MERLAGPLDERQVDDFVERGFTTLQRGFSAPLAQAVRHALGRRLGVDLDDPRCWDEPRVWLQENLTGPPFADPVNDRFTAAVDQLVGPGRWQSRPEMGWWPVTFPGFIDPPYGSDWHIDGDFVHHVWSPEQAVLALFCFSDVEPGGGGTRLVAGSHHVAAGVLWSSEPAGMDPVSLRETVRLELGADAWDVIEVTCRAGDVVLAHPLIMHAGSHNHGTRPRVMAQPRFDMIEPMRTGEPRPFPVEVPLMSPDQGSQDGAGRCWSPGVRRTATGGGWASVLDT